MPEENKSVEVEVIDASGHIIPTHLRTTGIMDDDLEISSALFLFTDITERKRLDTELRRIATQDGLTQIPNRRTFDESLQKEWLRARRNQTPLRPCSCRH